MIKNKGITLIALVIAIVVLIILTGVAINLSMGQEGIFNRTKYAKEEYSNAQEYEMSALDNYSNEIESLVNLSNRGSETQIYKSQTVNQSSFATITEAIPELSITVDKGTYLVGYEGFIDREMGTNISVPFPLTCEIINKHMSHPIIVEVNEVTDLTFKISTTLKVRMLNVNTYAIKLK